MWSVRIHQLTLRRVCRLGAEGILVREESEIEAALEKAKKFAREGKPVLVNVIIARSAFREGSISL